jgi:hypothetical protein
MSSIFGNTNTTNQGAGANIFGKPPVFGSTSTPAANPGTTTPAPSQNAGLNFFGMIDSTGSFFLSD